MYIKHIKSCRICGNPNLKPVIDLGPMYSQGSFLKTGVPNPTRILLPNEIVRCDTSMFEDACGLIQTSHSILPSILYANYWYKSGVSETMRNHLKSIVVEACDIVNSRSSGRVLDIASNDNTLLKFYPSSFDRVGIDPSDIAGKQKDEGINVINDFFPSENELINKGKFSIVTSIACFYDIEDPFGFISKIEEILTHDGIWIFEVAYWKSMVENLSYDSIVNEHILHYHLESIEYLLSRRGLKLFKARKTDTNGGSIMCYVTKKDCNKYDTEQNKASLSELRIQEFDAQLNEASTYFDFRKRVALQRAELVEALHLIKSQGKTIHLYGASTKMNTILGFCQIGLDVIEYAAERSVEKCGATTISGIKIISEKESLEKNPDYYLVGPYHFKKEILARETEFRKRGGKFIFPLPEVEII